MTEALREQAYLTIDEFAELARTNVSTVRYWRQIGFGPAGFKLGKRVLYDADEVRLWIQAAKATANVA